MTCGLRRDASDLSLDLPSLGSDVLIIQKVIYPQCNEQSFKLFEGLARKLSNTIGLLQFSIKNTN